MTGTIETLDYFILRNDRNKIASFVAMIEYWIPAYAGMTGTRADSSLHSGGKEQRAIGVY